MGILRWFALGWFVGPLPALWAFQLHIIWVLIAFGSWSIGYIFWQRSRAARRVAAILTTLATLLFAFMLLVSLGIPHPVDGGEIVGWTSLFCLVLGLGSVIVAFIPDLWSGESNDELRP